MGKYEIKLSEIARQVAEDAKLATKGQRLRYLREFSRLNRDEAARLAGVKYVTYKDWENDRGNLPERRAYWLVTALQSEYRIQCTVEWLLYGQGELPKLLDKAQNTSIVESKKIKLPMKPLGKFEEEQQITAELEFFCHSNTHGVGYRVIDDGMLPVYAPNDWVAGVKYLGKEIDKHAIEKDCIVQLANGEILLRNVQKGKEKGFYALLCTNNQTIVSDKILYEVKLMSAAPVIWHRRTRF